MDHLIPVFAGHFVIGVTTLFVTAMFVITSPQKPM